MYNNLQGFEISEQKNMVYILHKVSYCLNQAPKLGITKLMHFVSLGFHHCCADNNIYVFSQDALLSLVKLYVDDLITRSLPSKVESSSVLTSKPHLGLLHYFSVMEVYQSHDSIFLSQHRYVKQLLETSSMSHFRPLSCAMDPNSEFSPEIDSPVFEDITSYRRLIGSLLRLTYTRLFPT